MLKGQVPKGLSEGEAPSVPAFSFSFGKKGLRDGKFGESSKNFFPNRFK